MFRIKTLTLAMATTVFIAGCATGPHSPQGVSLGMQPVQETRHGQADASAHYQLGRYYHGQMRYAQAITAYRKALALEPHNVEALTALGIAHASLGNYDEALPALKSAAALQPDSPQRQNNLGYIHWLRSEKAEAIDAYRHALRIDPTNERARQNLRLAQGEPPAESKPSLASSPAQPAIVQTPAAASRQMPPGDAIALHQLAPQVFALTLPNVTTPLAAQSGAMSLPATEPLHTTGARAPQAAAVDSAFAPRQSDASPQRTTALDAPVTTVVVLNGNGMRGIARHTADVLSRQGYAIAAVGDYAHHAEQQTRIEFLPGHVAQAQEMARLLAPTATLVQSQSLAGAATIRVVLGRDMPAAALPTQAQQGMEPGQLAVVNANGVNGMAKRVAQYLTHQGYPKASLHNLRPFNRAVTRIEFRKGYEAEARRLASLLPVQVAYVEQATTPRNVRLVLGHDMRRNMAAWSLWLDKVQFAELHTVGQL